jgi:hypothetical protein
MAELKTILSYTLGSFMLFAGLNKLIGRFFGSHWAQERYTRVGHPPLVFYGSGAIETIGGSLLFSSRPKVRLGGVAGLLSMIIWLEWAGWRNQKQKQVDGPGRGAMMIPIVLTEVGLVVLGWLSWGEV